MSVLRLRGRSDVGLAMVNGWGILRGRARDADFDGVELSVVRWRNEAQIVFVAHQLRDLGENRGKVLAGCREINAASVGTRYSFKLLIGFGKTLGGCLGFVRDGRVLLGMFFVGR